MDTPTLELHVDPDVTVALWCPHCGLPSAWRVNWMLADSETLQVRFRGTHTTCQECGRCWQGPTCP